MFKNIIEKIFTKKRLVSWGAAVAFVAGAAAVGMSQPEFKEAVCGAPVIEDAK